MRRNSVGRSVLGVSVLIAQTSIEDVQQGQSVLISFHGHCSSDRNWWKEGCAILESIFLGWCRVRIVTRPLRVRRQGQSRLTPVWEHQSSSRVWDSEIKLVRGVFGWFVGKEVE